MKREKRLLRAEDETGGQVATNDDLTGYGFDNAEEVSEDPENSPTHG